MDAAQFITLLNAMKTFFNEETGQQEFVELSAEELAEIEDFNANVAPILQLKSLRAERNRLLSETDYLALSDATLTDEMRTYRQALRDLPANTADPANPVWPVKPGGTP